MLKAIQGHTIEANYVAVADRTAASNRDVIIAVEAIAASNRSAIVSIEASKVEMSESSQAVQQLVWDLKPELLELRRAIHTSSCDTLRDVKAVVETAVDQSPLLEALGHSEVLTSLRQLQQDVRTGLDFTPLQRTLRELPSAAEFSQVHSGVQRIITDISSVQACLTIGPREAVCTPRVVSVLKGQPSPISQQHLTGCRTCDV